MFGSGWIATPLLGGAPRGEGASPTPLTWMFCCEAENYKGPLCCYPPQMFTRRTHEWKRFRGAEDPSLDPSYLTVDPLMTLGHTGPNQARMGPGGEFPNLQCVFSEADTYWKIPRIALPGQGRQLWAGDFKMYFADNHDAMWELLQQGGDWRGFSLRPERDVQVGMSHSGEIGVKSVRDEQGRPAFNGKEVDHVIRLPIDVFTEGGNVYYQWKTDPKSLSRYVKTTNEPADVITNGNGEQFQRHWCDFVPESEVPYPSLLDKDYPMDEDPTAYKNRASESAYQGHEKSMGDLTIELEDGAVVYYRWYKFIEQPAMRVMAAEFPDFYTPTELDRIQRSVEQMHQHWCSDSRSFLENSHSKLVSIEKSCFVSPPEYGKVGYVPVATGLEYPKRGSKQIPTQQRRW